MTSASVNGATARESLASFPIAQNAAARLVPRPERQAFRVSMAADRTGAPRSGALQPRDFLGISVWWDSTSVDHSDRRFAARLEDRRAGGLALHNNKMVSVGTEPWDLQS